MQWLFYEIFVILLLWLFEGVLAFNLFETKLNAFQRPLLYVLKSCKWRENRFFGPRIRIVFAQNHPLAKTKQEEKIGQISPNTVLL